GCRAVVGAEALGLSFEALVFVTMRQADRDTVLSFEEALTGVPHVVQAQRLFGDPDYLLRVVTTDLAAYQQLYDNELIALPGVQRMASTLVMKRVVHARPLPAWPPSGPGCPAGAGVLGGRLARPCDMPGAPARQ